MIAYIIILSTLLAAYVGYTWYWQATIAYRGRYRYSVLIILALFIWLGFKWNFIDINEPGLPIILSLLIVLTIMDGFNGLAEHRVVVTGYLRRTIKYSDILHITLINVSTGKKPVVMAIFRTAREAYYLPFSHTIEELLGYLKPRLMNNVSIEIQNL